MDATDLLAEFARRRDVARSTRDFTALASLFADDAELIRRGDGRPDVRGREAIERAFRDDGPEGEVVLGAVVGAAGGCAHAVVRPRLTPRLVAGAAWLTSRAGRIVRLEMVALPDGPRAPTPREAVRAIVVAPGPVALLVRCRETHHDPTRDARCWWVTPGGGVDPGETDFETLRRELAEETGLDVPAVPRQCVWTREHVFTWNDNAVHQRERYYVVEVESAAVLRPRFDAAALAIEGLDASRWWRPDELLAARDDVFAPRRLPELVGALLRDGPPIEPIDAGI